MSKSSGTKNYRFMYVHITIYYLHIKNYIFWLTAVGRGCYVLLCFFGHYIPTCWTTCAYYYEFINSKQTTNRLSTYLWLSSLESCSKIQKSTSNFWDFLIFLDFFLITGLWKKKNKMSILHLEVDYDEATTCIFYCAIFSYYLTAVSSLHSISDKSWKVI